MSQLMADLLAGSSIKLSIFSMATTAIDGGRETGQLLITLSGVRSPQFMKAFQSMLMQNVPRRTHYCL